MCIYNKSNNKTSESLEGQKGKKKKKGEANEPLIVEDAIWSVGASKETPDLLEAPHNNGVYPHELGPSPIVVTGQEELDLLCFLCWCSPCLDQKKKPILQLGSFLRVPMKIASIPVSSMCFLRLSLMFEPSSTTNSPSWNLFLIRNHNKTKEKEKKKRRKADWWAMDVVNSRTSSNASGSEK